MFEFIFGTPHHVLEKLERPTWQSKVVVVLVLVVVVVVVVVVTAVVLGAGHLSSGAAAAGKAGSGHILKNIENAWKVGP